MIPFLSGFLGNLPAIQTKQILRLLARMRDQGEIRTQEEFQSRLAGLLKSVKGGELSEQTPYLLFADGDLLESDAIRTFLDLARLDSEAMLGAVETIGDALRAHYRILSQNYFDAIEASIVELEAETTAYEVLETHKFSGFGTVLKTCNFSGAISTPGASKPDSMAVSLFTDSRGGVPATYSPPGRGEPGLRLGLSSSGRQRTVSFSSVEISTDSTTPQTEFSISSAENIPTSAIDGSLDTAWKHSVLLNEHPSSCRLKLRLVFPSAKRINAFAINGLADVPMKLVSASYKDAGGQEFDLGIGTSSSRSRSGLIGSYVPDDVMWIIGNREQIFQTGDITAKSILLTLQQDTGVDGEFFYDAEIGSWKSGYRTDELVGYITNPADWASSSVAEPLGITQDSRGRMRARFAEYVFGLKNAYALERDYDQTGLFVIEPFEVKKTPNTLALYTDVDWPIGSLADIEFLLKKENYSMDGSVLDTELFPIVPYGTSSINERVFLSRRDVSSINSSGVLRFYPDFSQSFKLYSDGVEMTLGVGYYISIDDGATWLIEVPTTLPSTVPMVCRIRVASPSPSGTYVCSYMPLASTGDTGEDVWLNTEKTVRLDSRQVYSFSKIRPTGEVSSCKLCLQIITRANSLDTRTTPYLKELVLLGG